ncbi:MAG: M23 family metallopeptidase [Candidatus Margulisiibacteriota bacterium]
MTTRAVYIKRRIVLAIILVLFVAGMIFALRAGMKRYQIRAKYSKIKVVEGRLKPGQVLFDSLLENNVSREAANEVLVSVGKILDLNKLQVKDEYRIYINQGGQIEKFIYEKSPVDQYFVVRGEYGKLHAFKPAIFLDKEVLAKEFTIKSSLFAAMLKAKEKDALVFKFVDVFAWDIDFYSYPRVGDKIKIYFEKYLKDGKFVKYGRVLAAQYAGRQTFNAVYFEPKNNYTGYYALDGKPAEKMFLKSPLKFTGRITSYFGYRRDPFTSRHGSHGGVDFAAYYGAPIVATSDGIVTYSGWRGAYGRMVSVRHANGYETRYGHCSRILVRSGQKVSQGQVIANVGSTGRSTGPHCHYEIRSRGSAFNPLKFNQPKRKPLTGKDLENFKVYSKKIWENIEQI